MQAPLIQKYTFNSPDSPHLEVKPLGFLREKSEKSGLTHRADFYQFLWLREGQLRLTLDFEEVVLGRRKPY